MAYEKERRELLLKRWDECLPALSNDALDSVVGLAERRAKDGMPTVQPVDGKPLKVT